MHVTRRHLLPALASLMLAFGLASTAAAAGTSGPAPSTAPAFDDSAAPAGAGYVVLRELLASGLLPDGARAAIARLVGEQAEVVHPGFACRRIAQDPDADPELVERCREQAQGGGAATAPGQICRRVAQDPSAHPEYAERCREWIASHDQGSGSSAAQACRRVAQAHPDVSEDLVQRVAGLVRLGRAGARRDLPPADRGRRRARGPGGDVPPAGRRPTGAAGRRRRAALPPSGTGRRRRPGARRTVPRLGGWRDDGPTARARGGPGAPRRGAARTAGSRRGHGGGRHRVARHLPGRLGGRRLRRPPSRCLSLMPSG
jgi:hypothetical protein